MREYLKKTWMLASLLWVLLPLGQTVFAQSNPKLAPLIRMYMGGKLFH